jgi:hypothetical protein
MVTSKLKNGAVKGTVLKNISPVRGKDKTGPLFEVMTMLPLIPLKNHQGISPRQYNRNQLSPQQQ